MSEPLTPASDLETFEFEAHAMIDRRRFDDARRVLAHGLQQYPDAGRLQYLSAFIAYAEDDNDTALAEVRRLLAREPDHYGARRLLGQIFADLKRNAEAEGVWIALLKEYPEDPDCYAAYAELMLHTMNLDKAKRLAQEGLRHAPGHSGCLYVASLLELVDGRDTSGASALETLIQEHPEHVRSSSALTIALHQRGDNAAALRVAQAMLRADPNSAQRVELVRELRVQTHWSMLPLYPMQRWGWGGAIALWAGGVLGLRALDGRVPEPVHLTLLSIWLCYVAYSWIWPRVLPKLLR